MLENHWRGGKQEKLRLYWKVREERKQGVREKYERLKPHLEERGKRLWAANEALSFGRGGVRGDRRGAGDEPYDPLARQARTARGTPRSGRRGGRRTTASPRGWTKIGPGETSVLAPRPGADRRPGHAGGSYGSSEVDVEELEPHCERAEPARLDAQCHHREQVTARGVGIQLASFAQDPRGRLSSGSG